MKPIKHNKKRNTAFLFEIIIKEISKQVIENNNNIKHDLIIILKEFFGRDKILSEELEAYRSCYEEPFENNSTAGKVLIEAKIKFNAINRKAVFNEQTKLLNRVNHINEDVFNNFVKNYKFLASLNQYFLWEDKTSKVKDKVALTEILHGFMAEKEENGEAIMEEVDEIVYRTFLEKFNTQYGELLEEQKELLKLYVMATTEEGEVTFLSFLSEELNRLKGIVSKSITENVIDYDSAMKEKTKEVISLIESYSKRTISEEDFEKILVIQELVKEIQDNGDQDSTSHTTE